MVLRGLWRRSIWSRRLLFFCLLTLFLSFFISCDSFVSHSSAFDVEPANLSDQELEKRIDNDIDDERKVSFWELPLWIKLKYVAGIVVAVLGIWKFLPFILGRIKSVLKSTKRQRILDYLEWNFGVSIRELEENLNINRSTLRYHLVLLEKWGKVVSVRYGTERLFFSKKLPDGELELVTFLRSETKRKILELLSQNGALSKEEIAEMTGLNLKNVHYHFKYLKMSGMVEKRGGKFRIVPEQREKFLSLLKHT